MPELPDLEVFSMNLNKALAGKKLSRLKVSKGVKPGVSKAALAKALENEKLEKVAREGKELRLLFANGNVLGLHMMLHGKLEWIEKTPPKYTLLELWFSNNKGLALTDFQRKARFMLNPGPAEAPDAMSGEANAAFWKKQLQKRTAIKKLMLDQHIVGGIGNAYADEILWKARISPFSVSNKIPAPKVKALAAAVKQVLKKAVQQIRKEDPEIIGGELRDFLLIHNSHKKKSPGGATILTKTVGGRKTYYTKEQQLFS